MKIRLIVCILVFFIVFNSCSFIRDIIFEPPLAFEKEDIEADVSGELVISGTIENITYDSEVIKINDTIRGQVRYIKTKFGTESHTVNFYRLDLYQLNCWVVLFFSKSANSGLRARIRLYRDDYSSDSFLQINNAKLMFEKIKYYDKLEKLTQFILEQDSIFTYDNYKPTNIKIHKDSFLNFTNYKLKNNK